MADVLGAKLIGTAMEVSPEVFHAMDVGAGAGLGKLRRRNSTSKAEVDRSQRGPPSLRPNQSRKRRYEVPAIGIDVEAAHWQHSWKRCQGRSGDSSG
jgi:hypothetical protein